MEVSKETSAAQELFSSLPAWDRVPDSHKERTPERFVKMLHQMTDREEFSFTTFPIEEDRGSMVTLSPIPFYTFCAHHVVPFFGIAHVAYVPKERLAGLSKFARAVKYCAKGFWVQEELTEEISTMIEENLNPNGVGVILQAEHMCMAMRGVQQPGVTTTTSSMRGVFADDTLTYKQEFMSLVNL